MKKSNINVLTYGSFDTMHWGHINILKCAAELGDNLYVGISSNSFNELKNKKTYHDENIRKMMVDSIKYVSKSFFEYSWDQKAADIKKFNIDIFVMGDDWKGKFDHLSDLGVKVLYLPRTKSISSTQIKNILIEELD